jgi:hypothetical protein
MSEKRITIERHFGKTWVCTCTQYGETHVKAMIHAPIKKKNNPDGSITRDRPTIYTGIGGFIHRKDFDFEAAAGAAISSALNKAGYYTLDY